MNDVDDAFDILVRNGSLFGQLRVRRTLDDDPAARELLAQLVAGDLPPGGASAQSAPRPVAGAAERDLGRAFGADEHERKCPHAARYEDGLPHASVRRGKILAPWTESARGALAMHAKRVAV